MLGTVPLSADGNHNTQTTTTPIKHVVVIFQENRSFDQYFATYPLAANLPGETPFYPRHDTPTVNGLATAGLLTANPNSAQPQRLSPAEAIVCSDSHDYTDEQNAFDHGLMDMFPEHTLLLFYGAVRTPVPSLLAPRKSSIERSLHREHFICTCPHQTRF